METNKELQIGCDCWIQYEKGTYLGKTDEGKHRVFYIKKDETITKEVPYEPIPDNIFTPPPFIKRRNVIYRFIGESTAWLRNEKLKMFYKYWQVTNPSNSVEYMDTEEIAEAEIISVSEFLSSDEIEERLSEIDDEIAPVKKEIRILREKLNEINKKRIPIQAKCAHQWEKDGEEEDTGSNCLGEGHSQGYICNICGETQTSHYSTIKL